MLSIRDDPEVEIPQMTTSMTAFARTERGLDEIQLVWEIRSVNHRYLDINLKLPEEYRSLDGLCREAIGENLGRGRIDAQLKVEKNSTALSAGMVDENAVKELVNMLDQIEAICPDLESARTTDILRWPGVLRENQHDHEILEKNTLDGLQITLAELVENRQREGARLAEMIQERVSQCRSISSDMNAKMGEIQDKIKDKWVSRIEQIARDFDGERIAQEIALILTKSDVSEELDRLQTHLDEVERLLKTSKPVGRSLDFLMQELNREANTLGSKSIDQSMTNASIELKVLIDQIREQVQNIE